MKKETQTETSVKTDDQVISQAASTAAVQAPSAPPAHDLGQTFRVANLLYTKKGLLALFFWLLWFDFCFTLMETVLGPILQFRLLNDLKADSVLYIMMVVTIPGVINFFLNPIVSIRSDRHRGKRGRRIPYLLVGAPLVCGALALLGFGNEIGAWMHQVLPPLGNVTFFGLHPLTFLTTLTLQESIIWTFGILFLIFTVFNMLLGTTFYYLFNDVVPEEHFVKFMAYMRVVGGVAGMIYSWYIFGYSDKWGPLDVNLGFFEYHNPNFWYPKLILVGAAIFYTIASTVALLKVKEPNYPAPPPLSQAGGFFKKAASSVQTIVKECFSHRFYVLYFITMMITWMSYQMSQFMNPMRKDLGIDMMMLGKINTITGFVSLILTIVTANFGDRYRPLPLMVFSMMLAVIVSPISFLFLVPGLAPETYLYIQVAISVIQLPIMVVMAMAESPLSMSLLPRERYGQFSAAQSMMRMLLAGILGSYLAAKLMQVLVAHYGTYAWRFSFVWNGFFQALALFCYYMLYREWKRLGGKDGFKPPKVGPVSASEAEAANNN